MFRPSEKEREDRRAAYGGRGPSGGEVIHFLKGNTQRLKVLGCQETEKKMSIPSFKTGGEPSKKKRGVSPAK